MTGNFPLNHIENVHIHNDINIAVYTSTHCFLYLHNYNNKKPLKVYFHTLCLV